MGRKDGCDGVEHVAPVALVTGGSGELGTAICGALASDSYDIAVHYNRGIERARELALCTRRCGVRAEIYRADLRNAAEADELVKSVLRDFGRIDVLINNAGLSCHGLLLQTSDEAIDAVFDVNVKGAFYMSRAVLRHMLAVRAGAIVNISSVAAAKPLVGNSCYAASKAALEGFTRALAAEVGSKGIRVNAVAPGIIDTPMTRDIRQRADGVLRSGIALRRYGTPGEVGAAVAYLASSRASFITGHVLDVSGGKDHQSLHKHP